MNGIKKMDVLAALRECKDELGNHVVFYTGRIKPMYPELYVYICLKCGKEWSLSACEHRVQKGVFGVNLGPPPDTTELIAAVGGKGDK